MTDQNALRVVGPPRRARWRAVFLSATGVLALATPPAFAQAGADTTEDRAGTGSEIVVTGSRVVRQGYDAPTPTTVIGTEQLVQKAPATLIDAVATLPAFRQTSTPATGGIGVAGTGGASFVNLRGIGANRTLVLLDGRRFVPSTVAGTTDVAIFPSALVSRLEAVTGGASAAWGSDAVAGVVNFILDTKFTGLKGDFAAGMSAHGDTDNYKAALTYGTGFAGGRGHALLSGEYYTADGIARKDRSFSRYNTAVVTNPAYTATNGEFQRLVSPYTYFSTATYGGLVLNGPLAGTVFEPGGGLSKRATPDLLSGTSAVFSGPQYLPFIGNTAVLTVPQDRYSIFGRLSYEVADGVTLFAEGTYARSDTGPLTGSAPSTVAAGNLTIRRDNAFLPAAFAARMDDPNGDGNTADAITSFTLGMFRNDWGAGLVSQKNTTKRGVIGLDADLGNGWTANAYYQHGENKGVRTIGNNAMWSRVHGAADAVRAPGGSIICRSTLTNPNDGCVALNVFGEGASTPEMLAYVMGVSRADLKTTQDVVAFDVSGEPFSLWAGPVSIAVGGEYRREEAVQVVDERSAARLFALANPQPIDGRYSVKEAFAEVVVPLLADVPMVQKLDLNAAARITDYSTSGSVNTWKVGATWDVIDDIRLRFTRSRDIRAPNVLELFSGTLQSSASIMDPFLNNLQYFFQGTSSGNRDLNPEKADTVAAGVVVRPSFLPGFSASVDYYDIKIDDAIATLTLQEIMDRCFAGTTALCALAVRDPDTGRVISMNSPYLNFQSLKTWGLDMEASYRFGLLGGNAVIRLLANYVGKLATDDGRQAIDRAGDISAGQPKWNFDLTTTYAIGPWDFYVNVNRIGGGKYNNTYVRPVDIDDNTIGSRIYVNASIQHRFTVDDNRDLTLFFNVSNLFNEKPPALFGAQGGAAYDRIGTRFKGGVRFRL
jgi:outer membrane receptor protein involved in Fe transport